MPYIVTTDRGPNGHGAESRAVATLEEDEKGELRVRNADGGCAVDYRSEYGRPWLTVVGPFDSAWVANDVKHALRRLPESGGTVGPLPDGTTIEVERVTLGALVQALIGDGSGYGRAANWNDEEKVIAAYNAREASGDA